MSRLRILCLHGFTSNGAVHAHQSRRLVQSLPEYDFIFPDGPHPVDMSPPNTPAQQSWMEYVNETSTAGHRAWWFARDADPATGKAGDYEGIERSLEVVGDLIRGKGGVDAICGFSQGACFAGLLCALLQPRQADHPLRKLLGPGMRTPKAGVIFSGFKARFERLESVYEGGVDVPMLHVIGREDRLVVRERSEKLAELCEEGEVLVHDGGHDLPRGEDDQGRVVGFLRAVLGNGRGEDVAVSL